MTKSWRAHVQSISRYMFTAHVLRKPEILTVAISVNYANAHNVILTASKDATIRVWTAEGYH